MSKEGLTYERIIHYLKGFLSNRQRHELEREVMQDAFDEESFEGLNLLSASELESDISRMEEMLENRTMKQGRKIRPVLFRIAAAVILLVGLGTVMYLVVFNGVDAPDTGYIAESKESLQPAEERAEETPASREGVTDRQTLTSVPSVLPEERPLDETSRQMLRPEPEQKTTEDEVADTPELDTQDQILSPQYDYTTSEAKQQERMKASAIALDEAAAARMSEREPDEVMARTDSFTARVVDQSGNPVSGVAVHEKGVVKGVVTDINGVFSISTTGPSSLLTLSSVIFTESELAEAGQVAGMDRQGDAILSLKEIVITERMNARKTKTLTVDAPEALSPVISQDPALIFTFEVGSPVPPGGSLRTFKRQVEELLDNEKLAAGMEQMQDITGGDWIDVMITIQMDGSVGDIAFANNIPPVVAEAYRASIKSLPSWQPALQGDVPVESEVGIRFVVSLD